VEQEILGKVTFEEEYGIYSILKSEIISIIDTLSPTYKNVEISVDDSSGIPYVKIKSDDSKHFNRVIKALKKTLSTFLMTAPNKTFETMLVETMKQKKWTFSSAESMTGGLIASKIISIPDASQVIKEAYVVYANETKEKVLGVSRETIERFGVVSKEVALEMVEQLYIKTNANICISVTGIAGPTGGDDKNPIGTVYIGLRVFDKICVQHFVLRENRVENQKLAASIAIISVYEQIYRQEKK